MIQHVSYLIKQCKISLLIYSGSSSLSNAAGRFSDSPGINKQLPVGKPDIKTRAVKALLNKKAVLTKKYFSGNAAPNPVQKSPS